jgi:hypothetical protein
LAIQLKQQVWLVLLTLMVAPMSMIPLELQRRIVEQDLSYLLLLCGLYLVVLLIQGGLKHARSMSIAAAWSSGSRCSCETGSSRPW